jgi:ribosomal protein L29
MRQSSGKVKTGQLWAKNKADLAKQLGELKTELGQLRTQKIAGGSASKLTKMWVFQIHFPRGIPYRTNIQSRHSQNQEYT